MHGSAIDDALQESKQDKRKVKIAWHTKFNLNQAIVGMQVNQG